MSETNSGMTNPVETLVRAPWPEDKLPLKLKNPKCPICGGALFIAGVNACEQEDTVIISMITGGQNEISQ